MAYMDGTGYAIFNKIWVVFRARKYIVWVNTPARADATAHGYLLEVTPWNRGSIPDARHQNDIT